MTPESRPIGLAIVGCGGAGADVARAVERVAGFAAVAVHDRDVALATDLAEPLRARVHDSIASLLDDPRVDVVYVALPHDLLTPVARVALLARKHVLVEKPMATTLPDLDELAETAERVDRMLGVFYEMRFTRAAMTARRIVRSGAIGNVVAVNIRTVIDKPATYWQAGLTGRSRGGWRGEKARAGGGVVLMNTSHQLDIVFMATGLDIVSVASHIRTLTPGIDVEDLAVAVLRFSNGALGSIVAGAHVGGAIDGETIELFATGGRLILNPYSGQLTVTRRGEAPRVEVPRAGHTDEGDPFIEALATFADAVRTSLPAPVGPSDARKVLATISAIYESAAHGGALTPVEPWTRRHY